MKKILFLIFLYIGLFFTTSVSSDFSNDFTLIDCENGIDSTGTPFDSTKPYKTLNDGIEKTIQYINENYNKSGNENSFSGVTFNIKVSCSLLKGGINNINLNFYGNNYSNYLKIEGIGDNGLMIQDSYFNLPNASGNIIFKNAKFLGNDSGYYFTEYNITSYSELDSYFHTGVKLEDSYLKLSSNKNLSAFNSIYGYYGYKVSFCPPTGCYGWTYSHNNQFFIKNSTIDIDILGDYSFQSPMIIKDSKINFINNGTGVYNINFTKNGSYVAGYDFNTSTFISNEIDLGGNNFTTLNEKNMAFINNRFFNFQSIILGANDDNKKYALFINNLFENLLFSIDITLNRNIINNVFMGNFIDTYDTKNLRKNFNISNIGPKGIGWIFKKSQTPKILQIDYTSSSLYKEITGQNLPNYGDTYYAIFNW